MKILATGVALIFACAAAWAQDPSMESGVPVPEQEAARIRQDGAVAAANLVHLERPVYPPLARQTRVSGNVRLHIIVSREGKVSQVEIVSGHPLLVQSALDAVRKWQYRPTLLNGKPVEVDTTVDLIYSLVEDLDKKSPQLLTPAPNTIDPVLRADLMKLMELTSSDERSAMAARKAVEGMRPTMLRNISDETQRQKFIDAYEDKLLAIFKTDTFREEMITVHAKYFNDEDAKTLIAFYQTPTGRKFNDSMRQFTSDMIEVGERLRLERNPWILRELCHEHPALARKLADCRVSERTKRAS